MQRLSLKMQEGGKITGGGGAVSWEWENRNQLQLAFEIGSYLTAPLNQCVQAVAGSWCHHYTHTGSEA